MLYTGFHLLIILLKSCRVLMRTYSNLINIRFLIYIFFGVVSAIIEITLFFILRGFFDIFTASFIGSVASVMASFIFNRYFTFREKKTDKPIIEIVKFFILGFINSTLSAYIVMVLSISIPSTVSKIIAMAMIVVWNYFIMGRFIFKNKK